jgi:hypothetical protein
MPFVAPAPVVRRTLIRKRRHLIRFATRPHTFAAGMVPMYVNIRLPVSIINRVVEVIMLPIAISWAILLCDSIRMAWPSAASVPVLIIDARARLGRAEHGREQALHQLI